jgi:cytoskeleton protein RodZ
MAESRTVPSPELEERARSVAWEIGQALRQARLAGDKLIPDIAEKLRIKADHLDALEEGELERLPARIYTLGFLRTYATYLGLDGEELASRLKSAGGTGALPPPLAFREPIGRVGRPRLDARIVAVLLLGPVAYGGYWLISYNLNPDRTVPTTAVPVETTTTGTGVSSGAANQIDDATVVESAASTAPGGSDDVGPGRGDMAEPLQPDGADDAMPMMTAPEETARPNDFPVRATVPGGSDGRPLLDEIRLPEPAAAPIPPVSTSNDLPFEPSDSDAPLVDGGMAENTRPIESPVESAADGNDPNAAPAVEPAPSPPITPAAVDNRQVAPPPKTVMPAARFALHVASVREHASVPGEWRRLAKQYASLVGMQARAPRRVEVPGKGIFYRVVGGAFATRAEAQAACERLRSEGGDCQVVAF